MKKTMLFAAFVLSAAFFLNIPAATAAVQKSNPEEENTPSTRSDAVIFKIHDIVPISENGVVTGCDYSLTLYNRTSINFRTFTLNLKWNDTVAEQFHFDSYVEAILGPEVVKEQNKFFESAEKPAPLQSSVTVSAFGADKQISLKGHLNSEKCYLLLSNVDYSVTPCDIARSMNIIGNQNASVKDNSCTHLFQFVNTQNPEYFGNFKRTSATEEAMAAEALQSRELADIDVVIGQIVENLGTSDNTLAEIK